MTPETAEEEDVTEAATTDPYPRPQDSPPEEEEGDDAEALRTLLLMDLKKKYSVIGLEEEEVRQINSIMTCSCMIERAISEKKKWSLRIIKSIGKVLTLGCRNS